MDFGAGGLELGAWVGAWIWRLGLCWGLGLGALGLDWGLDCGFGHVDLASCGLWGWGLGAWGVGWSLDWAFGLVLGHVDWAAWDLEHGTLDLGPWDFQKC